MTTHIKNFARVYGGQPHFLGGTIISVEIDITNGLHSFSIVGLPNKAVEEARDRVGSALKNSGFPSPKQENRKIVVSLAPAEIKKEGSCFDCAIAIGYLLASQKISFNPDNKLFIGELSLDGSVQPIREIISVIQSAQKQGITECYVPRANAPMAHLIEGVTIYPIDNLRQLVEHLDAPHESSHTPSPLTSYTLMTVPAETTSLSGAQLFDSIKGQETAKRALQIAAAGGHNLLMIGPPGTGKTMLAQAFAELLPELSYEASLQVTTLHSSFSDSLITSLMRTPPFRAPHHSSSVASIIGNGTGRPGEITLAHHGVLFLDEFPEFDRRVIESLRQPLEERSITIARSKGSVTLPAHIIFIAAMNPCPCGYFGSLHKTCSCTPVQVDRYRKKISGPIMDRIDLWTAVEHVAYETLGGAHNNSSDLVHNQKRLTCHELKKSITQAHTIQEHRYHSKTKRNADLTAQEVSEIFLPLKLRDFLNQSAAQLKLSPRSYYRIIKVARTIADLAQSPVIEKEHLLEALHYRGFM